MSAGAARADEASALAKAEAAVAAERVRSTQEALLEAQKVRGPADHPFRAQLHRAVSRKT